MNTIPLNHGALAAIDELRQLGFRSLIVGGAVRDAVLGIHPKDVDIEVYGTDYVQLEQVLSKYGTTNLVGKSFGIVKFTSNGDEYDFSIPRRESSIGVGHRDFFVELDKDMSPQEAAERRDFTFNALAYDPINNEVLDFYGGMRDLEAGTIRATSEKFSEDPLRILRAMQFQSRMGFAIEHGTMATIRSMVLDGAMDRLPKERICEEWMKWAIKGKRPDLVFGFIHASGLDHVLPRIGLMNGVPQDAVWHPEGDVETHTSHVLRAAVSIADREHLQGDDKAVLVFAALCHDLAKPDTTETNIINGREAITSRGHEKMGGGHALEFLQAIGIKQSITEQVVPLVENHLEHVNISAIDEDKSRLKSVRKLAIRLGTASISQLLMLIEADISGRPPLPATMSESALLLKELSEMAGVTVEAEKPILMGRHLIELGMQPSIEFGTILREAKEAQDSGEFSNEEEGRKWLLTKV